MDGPDFSLPRPRASATPLAVTARPSLMALDWGTSQLRARLLGPGGEELAVRGSADGILAVQDKDFESPLRRLCGDWLESWDGPVLASGMIGSRQGWVEAPYLDCPADPASVAAALVTVDLRGGRRMHIVPGLHACHADGRHDVMRGEETQVWGAGLAPGGWAVLPGTHSKWVWMGEAERVMGFATFMTGELYSLLRQHSILGRLMPPLAASPSLDEPADASARWDAFDAGVQLAWTQPAQLLHTLFSVRTAGLMNQWPTDALPDHLSGLLIGAELAAARTLRAAADGVVLIGADDLSARYERALARVGISSRRASASATAQGQWRLACAAGLVAPTHS